MAHDLIITREIPPVPTRSPEAHKGNVGRILVVGGSDGPTTMIGAVALAANAAYRGGAGLVRMMVPDSLRTPVAVLAPCATLTVLPATAEDALSHANIFRADVLAIGPGLGESIAPKEVVALINGFAGAVVLDADGLNLLAAADSAVIDRPERVVLTPHYGELERLLIARGRSVSPDQTLATRRDAAIALFDLYGCTVVLKGHHTIVTNGQRLYVNETGNSGMATGGTGDVLTGLIAALIGQDMPPFEAAVLATYLHGLAGDFASEELGRFSMTAIDLLEYIPEAFGDHEAAASDLP